MELYRRILNDGLIVNILANSKEEADKKFLEFCGEVEERDTSK